MKRTIYKYQIDLDERGYFMAHVENSQGRTIVSYDLPQYDDYPYCVACGNDVENCTCPDNEPSIEKMENWDIFDTDFGITKNKYDVAGLEKHYKECGMMPQNAELVLVK